jgi:hypothetical protein
MEAWISLINETARLIRVTHRAVSVSPRRKETALKLQLDFTDEMRVEMGLSSRTSLWRQQSSLVGLSSSASKHIERTVFSKNHLTSASCFAVHNVGRLRTVRNRVANFDCREETRYLHCCQR